MLLHDHVRLVRFALDVGHRLVLRGIEGGALRFDAGDAVPVDLVEAYKWYLLAQRGHDPMALPNLLKLAGNLTPEQKTEAIARAHVFVPQLEPRPQ